MSQVDETLFASDSRRSTTLGNAGVVISQSDLNRIKASVREAHSSRSESALRTKNLRQLSKSRREMMQTMDDARLKQKAESGEAAVEETIRIRKKIARSIPNHDLTKKVRSIEQQAIALQGRRAQLEEKRQRQHHEVARERVFHHTLMRNTRAAQAEAARLERLRLAKNRDEAEALHRQVEENEQHRLLELERKENEGKLMLRQFEKAKEEERQAALRKAEKQRMMTQELVQANADAARRKLIRAEKDKRIDRAVLRYQRKKAEKERLAEEAEVARRIALEKETARLRSLQERASDEKAAEDAKRAKRHREQRELKERREAERREAERKRLTAETYRVVALQREHKQKLKQREVAQDARLMRRLAKEQAKALQRELDAEYERKVVAFEHGQQVLDQIAEKQARKREVVNEKYEERKRLNLQRRIENELLEQMKVDAMARLERERGIGVEWSRDIRRVEVESKKVTK